MLIAVKFDFPWLSRKILFKIKNNDDVREKRIKISINISVEHKHNTSDCSLLNLIVYIFIYLTHCPIALLTPCYFFLFLNNF